MIFDRENLFSASQAVTATAVSQNVVAVPKNAGVGMNLAISVNVVEKFVGLTSLEVQLQSADVDTGPFVTIDTTGAIALAELNSGKVINFGSLPPRTGKYLRLNYVVVGAGTAGKLTSGIVMDRQTSGKM